MELVTDRVAVPVTGRRRSSTTSTNGLLSTSTEQARDMPMPSTSQGAATIAPIKAILHDDPKRRAKGKESSSNKPVGLFSHLSQYSGGKPDERTAPANIHPSVVKFALHSAAYENCGGVRRCREMLLALQDAIKDYRANPEMAVSRHLDLYLKPMIGYMVSARPMAISMANAVRLIRHQISILPLEISDHEAQILMHRYIDDILMNRLELADKLIIQHGSSKISNGDVIMSFGRSGVVRDLIISAKMGGVDFRVIVVDSRPFQEGLLLLEELVANDISCTYAHVNAIGYMMKEVTKTIVGAAGIYANGTVLSRVGTAAVCTLSKRSNVPVIVCCETIKFSDRSQIDSFVFNEIGDPDALLRARNTSNANSLAGWREKGSLKLLNILYDVTPSEYVTVVITEIGLIPVTSIPVVLREYNNSSGGGFGQK